MERETDPSPQVSARGVRDARLAGSQVAGGLRRLVARARSCLDLGGLFQPWDRWVTWIIALCGQSP